MSRIRYVTHHHRTQNLGPKLGDALSKCETQVMHLICDGHPIKNIPGILDKSRGTISKQIEAIHIKWGCHSAVEILRYALLNGHYILLQK